MEIRTMTPTERMYAYAQSQQISMQTGMIGHLRADMGSSGNNFFSTWFDFNGSLKTDEFKAELDQLINACRFDKNCGGILSSREQMKEYCRNHANAGFEGNVCTEYGFRANTDHYSYMLRLNPSKGDYNLYCFCYQRESLDRHMHNAEKGIRFITPDYKEQFRIPDGDKVLITTQSGEKLEQVCRFIDEMHVEVGRNLYHICEFAERMERSGNSIVPLRSSLPEKCYSVLSDTGMIVVLKRGETGYYETDIPHQDKAEAQMIVDEMNSKGGVSKAQAEAMKAGSMFGFCCPAADPKNYDINGTPIRPKHKKRGVER